MASFGDFMDDNGGNYLLAERPEIAQNVQARNSVVEVTLDRLRAQVEHIRIRFPPPTAWVIALATSDPDLRFVGIGDTYANVRVSLDVYREKMEDSGVAQPTVCLFQIRPDPTHEAHLFEKN